MNEYSDVNTANSRYLYGLIILIMLAMWGPFLAIPRDYTLPLISLISIVVSPFIVATILLMFAKMSMAVDDTKIRIVFWWGFPKKEILLNDIRSVEIHKLSYWYGTGVKKVRQGSMWRAWGKTTVLVKQKNGKSVIIGSDTPDELLQAIHARLRS